MKRPYKNMFGIFREIEIGWVDYVSENERKYLLTV